MAHTKTVKRRIKYNRKQKQRTKHLKRKRQHGGEDEIVEVTSFQEPQQSVPEPQRLSEPQPVPEPQQLSPLQPSVQLTEQSNLQTTPSPELGWWAKTKTSLLGMTKPQNIESNAKSLQNNAIESLDKLNWNLQKAADSTKLSVTNWINTTKKDVASAIDPQSGGKIRRKRIKHGGYSNFKLSDAELIYPPLNNATPTYWITSKGGNKTLRHKKTKKKHTRKQK